jgi:hypothetical protein
MLGYLNPNYALPKERRERLNDSAIRYTSFLRFGNVEMASAFVEPTLRTQFATVFGASDRNLLRFTEIEVGEMEFGPERGSATVQVQARMYRLPSVREVSLIESQRWRYDPGSQRWYVTPDFAAYGGDVHEPIPSRPVINTGASPRSR